MKYQALLMSLGALVAACSPADPPPRAGGAVAGCATRAFAEIGGPFTLTDHTGKTVTEADFKGQPSLVYFGFTYCPDICPGTLVTVDRALRRLPDDVPAPRTILITIDPERDTPEALATYIATNAFPDNIVGLTGSNEAIETLATGGFKTGYTRIDDPESLAEYTMDHTSILYLMDENWQLKTFFTHEATAEEIGDCLVQHLG
jgi:protein SCO1/2